jgi:hypothetical protein
VNYARRQQYRRLSHAGKAGLGSVVAALFALVTVSSGAAALAGLLLLAALGLGLTLATGLHSPVAAAWVLARRTQNWPCFPVGTRLPDHSSPAPLRAASGAVARVEQAPRGRRSRSWRGAGKAWLRTCFVRRASVVARSRLSLVNPWVES